MKATLTQEDLENCKDVWDGIGATIATISSLIDRSGAHNVSNSTIERTDDLYRHATTFEVIFDSSAWTGLAKTE